MAFRASLVAAACLGALAHAKMSDAPYFYNTKRPLVVAHRGSDSRFPEESIGGLEDAYFQGTDFIEFDLQVTKDGILVVQHDSYLNKTTNIEEFADTFGDRMHSNGRYYVSDFKLVELRLLKRSMRESWRSPLMNDKFEIMTL